MAHNGEGLSWRDVERDVAQDPVVFVGIRAAVVGEPDVAKFDVAARIGKRERRFRGSRGQRLVKQFENPLARSHGRLQDIEFFAQILDRTEEALGVLHEGDQHADFHEARERAQSAIPKNNRDGRGAEQFNGREKYANAVIASL